MKQSMWLFIQACVFSSTGHVIYAPFLRSVIHIFSTCSSSCLLTGSQFMPLGHMLTFKAAYQIAAGLAYLHRKNVIFCDLKSDNILVWSMEVSDPVNIKLSDYGISRQSFHEGALGVEGTPGYQAPEIRPGIVYDEKVSATTLALLYCTRRFLLSPGFNTFLFCLTFTKQCFDLNWILLWKTVLFFSTGLNKNGCQQQGRD